MPPVNFADALPQPPPESPEASAGRSLSPHLGSPRTQSKRKSASRHRSSSESMLQSSKRFASLSHSSQYSSMPRLSVSPLSDSEDEKQQVDFGDKEYAANRARTPSSLEDASLMMDDDDTLRDFESKRRAPSTMDSSTRQRYVFGRPLPLWCTTRPKARGVASCIAKYAPCFWCSRESLSLTTTNQAILLRLNSLSTFFALVQVGSAVFLCFILFDNSLVNREARYVNRGGRSDLVNTPNLWSVNANILAAGFVGVCTLIAMFWARRGQRDIYLPGNLRFVWYLNWLIPIQVYLAVSMFDYHRVTQVYVVHWWSSRAMGWLRWKTCDANTYRSLCVVPIGGLPIFRSESEWCIFYYNSTACESIRNSAQSTTLGIYYFYYTINGVVCIIVVLLVSIFAFIQDDASAKGLSNFTHLFYFIASAT